MNKDINTELGQIKIYQRAIRQVAETAALEVAGVRSAGWKSCGIMGKFLNFMGIGGTRIKIDKTVNISIPITISWGENAIDIAREVQRKVVSHVLTNLEIDSLTVDIKIKRVEKDK